MTYGKAYDSLPDEKKLELWQDELEKDIARWNDIKQHGCNDPCWPDGVNLNLKRNHIIYDLYQIAEFEKKPIQLTFAKLINAYTVGPVDVANDPRIPPEVPHDFMVKPRRCTYFIGRS